MRAHLDDADLERRGALRAPLPPRRDGAHPRLRRSGAGRAALPAPRRHQRVRHRQRRSHRHARRPAPAARPAHRGARRAGAVRHPARRPSLPRVHPLSAGPAHHGRQARHAVDAGLRHRRRGGVPPDRDACGFRGCKGTTGTQASFLELFGGDHEKVRELDRRVAAKLGFRAAVRGDRARPTPGRWTAPSSTRSAGSPSRRPSWRATSGCCSTRASCSSRSSQEQIGSSAMAYKRNPMRAERISGLARFVISLQANTANTAASQWLERTPG